jgi:hypothetical protein
VEAVLGVWERKWERGAGAVPCFERKEGEQLGEKVPTGGPCVPEREKGSCRRAFRAVAGLGWPRVGPVLVFFLFCFFFPFFVSRFQIFVLFENCKAYLNCTKSIL